MEFTKWLLSTNYIDPPYYDEEFQRVISTVFDTVPHVAHPSARDPREVSGLDTADQQMD